jgi:putative transcriptional regulator
VASRRIAAVRSAAGALALAFAASWPTSAEPAEGGAAGGLAGQLLVATREMRDQRFAQAVIFIVRHDASGALGLIVNRPSEEVGIALLLKRLGLEHEGVGGSMRMHYGGPVEPGRVFVLHTADYAGEGTRVIADGIALTVHPDVLRAIGTGAGPRRALLALSYSGWAPGQLERELRAGRWVVVPADAGLVFDDDHGTKWQRATARRGTAL